jgi:hypothetical protein
MKGGRAGAALWPFHAFAGVGSEGLIVVYIYMGTMACTVLQAVTT